MRGSTAPVIFSDTSTADDGELTEFGHIESRADCAIDVPQTREHLGQIALHRSDRPLLLLTCRSTGFDTSRIQSRLQDGNSTLRIAVGALSQDRSCMFLERVLTGNSLTAHQKESLSLRGLGLPGLIMTIVLDHIRQGRIRRHGGSWVSDSDLAHCAPLPPAAVALVRPAFTELPISQWRTLGLLSLSTIPLTIAQIGSILRCPLADVAHSIIKLTTMGLVRQTANGISIGSSTIVEIVQLIQGKARVQALSRRAFRTLSGESTLKPSELDVLLTGFARSFDAAPELLHHALRAAQYYESNSQSERAVTFYRLALTGLPPNDRHERAWILEQMLILLSRMGNRQEFSRYAADLAHLLSPESTVQRMRLYKMLATHHSNLLELDESMRCATRAMAIARRQGLHAEHANCLDIAAHNQLRLGRPSAALKIARNSIRIRMHHRLRSDIAPAISIMAGAYYMEGDYARALNCVRNAIARTRVNSEKTQLPYLYNNLGIILMESGNLFGAMKAFRRCLLVSRTNTEFSGISTAHGNLAVCNFYAGTIAIAKDHSREFLAVMEHSGSQYGHGQFLLSLAELYLLRGHIHAALECISSSHSSSRQSRDELTELLARLQQGWLLYHIGDVSQAHDVLTELERPLHRAGFRVHEVSCALGLANVEIVSTRMDRARHHLTRTEGSLPKQHLVSELLFHLARGRYHRATGDLHAAQRDFIQVASLAKIRGFRPLVFEALLALSQCLLDLGNLGDAGTTLRRLVGLNRRLRYRLLEPWLNVALADYAGANGNSSEQRRHLLNARTSLLELSHNIRDPDLRNHFLNRPDSRTLLQRSEGLEDILYSGLAPPPETRSVSSALESIARINEQLHRRDSLKSTLALILDEAIRLSKAERGIIFLFDPSGSEKLKVARNLERGSLLDARKYTRTALERIRGGDIVHAADAQIDPEFADSDSVNHYHIRSVTCIPLRSRHSIIGALYLDSRRPGLIASPDLLKSLQIFSQQAATALEGAIRYFHLTEENRLLKETARLDHPILIGQGRYFNRLKQLIAAAARSELPVLILGESGTGKELVARAVHESGDRRAEPFLSIDCGALPENLAESELFGHLKGAFTGADTDKAGLFVAAGGGTLFLDEIANTSTTLQAKLLRAIQEREIRPLGALDAVPFRARLLAATNRDLRREAREKRFRQDLLFRLNGLTIEVPPLRDRKGEIPLLVSHFLQKASTRSGRQINKVTEEVLSALSSYDWPGNIRELENCIERAVALAHAGTIVLNDLTDAVRSCAVISWSEKKGEHRLIEEALCRFGGDKTRAADYIGWNRQKLYRKMAQYNIPRDFGRRNTA